MHVDPHPDGLTTQDAPTASVFNLAALVAFIILAVAAIGYRGRPDVHKRLMLFANITLINLVRRLRTCAATYQSFINRPQRLP
jgi:hypothetical protein